MLPFNALLFPILRDCLQSVCIFLYVILQKLRVRLRPCKIDLNRPVTVLLIVPSRYFCGGSFCFMSWCLKYFCAVGALCMFACF